MERKTLIINLRSGKDKVVVACDGVFAEGKTTAEALGMLLLTHHTKFINFCPQYVEYDIEDSIKSKRVITEIVCPECEGYGGHEIEQICPRCNDRCKIIVTKTM